MNLPIELRDTKAFAEWLHPVLCGDMIHRVLPGTGLTITRDPEADIVWLRSDGETMVTLDFRRGLVNDVFTGGDPIRAQVALIQGIEAFIKKIRVKP